MRTLRDLMDRHHRAGRVAWIGVRPERRATPRVLHRAEVGPGGLRGDHVARLGDRAGKRAVTLLQGEHLDVIGALCGTAATPEALRRNLVVTGINLAALKGRVMAVGAARLRLVSPCPPCSRMEETLGSGGYSAVRGHGGWYAAVEAPGPITVGDAVAPVAAEAEA